jgi:hypothetical protein
MAETQDQVQVDAEKALKEHNAETQKRLGADEYVVVAPYVTLKVTDDLGAAVVRGFLEGAVVKGADVDPTSLLHHVDSRLLAPVGHSDAEFAGPAGTPKPGEPPNVPVQEATPPTALDTATRIARNRDAAGERPTPRPAAKRS